HDPERRLFMVVATHSEDLAIERLAARCLRALITDVEQGRCIPEFGTALNSKIRSYGTARLEREVFLSAEESVTDSSALKNTSRSSRAVPYERIFEFRAVPNSGMHRPCSTSVINALRHRAARRSIARSSE